MTDLKRLLGYLGPYRRDMVIGALLVVIETAFELFIPLLMTDLIDVGEKTTMSRIFCSKTFIWESAPCCRW